MWPNTQETADSALVPEEILNGKLHFLYIAVACWYYKLSSQYQFENFILWDTLYFSNPNKKPNVTWHWKISEAQRIKI